MLNCLDTKVKFNKKFLVKNRYGRRYKEIPSKEWLMLSLADMDCLSPKPILRTAKKRINNNFFIYTYDYERAAEAIVHWYKTKHNLEISPNEIIFGSGVLHLLEAAISAFSKPGDGIIINTPAYASFLKIISPTHTDRNQVLNTLDWNEKTGRHENNWERIEKLFSDPKNKIFISCSPHNPIGRVWTHEELDRLVKLASKYGVFIISDEIWQDYCFTGHKHLPIVGINKEAAKCSIAISSPLKTFNMGGMQFGYAICRDKKVYDKLQETINMNIEYSSTHPIGYEMFIEGYKNEKCHVWSKNLVKHLEKNFYEFKNDVEANTKIIIPQLEASFVAWVDFSKAVKNKEELQQRLKKIKIVTCNGTSQGGVRFELCERINFGISRKDLKDLVKRLIGEFKDTSNK